MPLDPAHRALTGVLGPVLGASPQGLTDENLQSRLRGLLLMAVSNAKGWIVLTTGNKSEIATGYFTLYGDAVGGFAAIKDIAKTQVYELCRVPQRPPRPAAPVEPIPRSVLDKPPSAELRPDQRDDQSLPPYEVLDPVLEAYVERDRTKPEMVADGLRPGRRRRGGPPGRHRRVQAPAARPRGPHHRQGLRQGSSGADHQPLPGRRRRGGAGARERRRAPSESLLDMHRAAALLGAYCAVERRLFELTGSLAGDREADDPEVPVAPRRAERRARLARRAVGRPAPGPERRRRAGPGRPPRRRSRGSSPTCGPAAHARPAGRPVPGGPAPAGRLLRPPRGGRLRPVSEAPTMRALRLVLRDETEALVAGGGPVERLLSTARGRLGGRPSRRRPWRRGSSKRVLGTGLGALAWSKGLTAPVN